MTDTPEPSRWRYLTERERQVALGLATGSTCREVAKQLSISVKTVDTHRGHILKKLEVRNNVELLRFMLRDGQVTL